MKKFYFLEKNRPGVGSDLNISKTYYRMARLICNLYKKHLLGLQPGSSLTYLVSYKDLWFCCCWFFLLWSLMCGPQGRGQGVWTENHKNLGFLGILVQIPWKITKLPSQHSYCLAIISPLAKRHLNGVSLVGWWWLTFSVIWILCPPFIN